MRKRRFLMAVMAVVMVFAMNLGVMADAVVNNTTNHTYNIYQIFTGSQAAGDTALANVEWGSGVNSAAFLSALKSTSETRFNNLETGQSAFKDANSAQAVADVLKDHHNNSEFAKAFANVAALNRATVFATVTGNATSKTLPSGYYLFVDTTNVNGTGDARNSALLQITNQTLEIRKKYDVPELNKEIFDPVKETRNEAVDKSIGDEITYELTATFPKVKEGVEFNLGDYETYKLVFHDRLSKGQAVKAGSWKVYLVNGSTSKVDISSHFTFTWGKPSAKHDGSEQEEFTIGVDDIKKVAKDNNYQLTRTSKIVAVYTVTLTKDAVIGEAGNKNASWLEYSNDPNATGTGTTGLTPEDETYVFSYALEVTKVDGDANNKKLQNAQFVLEAVDGSHAGKFAQADAATGRISGWLDAKPAPVQTVPTTGNTGVFVTGADGTLQIKGIDSGVYKLWEIQSPAGYHLLQDAIKLVITADIDDTTGQVPTLDSLELKIDGDVVMKDGVPADFKADGKLPVTVENKSGSTLPTTGGIGTTIFYILGAALVIVAGVLLVTRRRMKTK